MLAAETDNRLLIGQSALGGLISEGGAGLFPIAIAGLEISEDFWLGDFVWLWLRRFLSAIDQRGHPSRSFYRIAAHPSDFSDMAGTNYVLKPAPQKDMDQEIGCIVKMKSKNGSGDPRFFPAQWNDRTVGFQGSFNWKRVILCSGISNSPNGIFADNLNLRESAFVQRTHLRHFTFGQNDFKTLLY